ncbi:MAG TPA: protein translocase subunit SecD [Solirubrobacteraceae bacterium]|jgi:SecD/SecF fusion protein|nr:protein translocase subunit SecD [Solirubrobacteraceae bacterium]
MTDRKRHGFILLLVAGLIAASFALIATRPTRLGLDLKGGVELVYKAEPNQETPVITPVALQRAVDVMNNRVNQLGVSQPQITTDGKNLIDVQLPNVSNVAQAESLVGSTAQLYFYDWEGSVLDPSTNAPAANGVLTQDASAVTLSQGAGNAAPGSHFGAAGAMGFYQAVKYASTRPAASGIKNTSGTGNQFFMFGSPGSSACAAFAAASNTKLQKGVHCLIASAQGAGLTAARATAQMTSNLSSAESAGTQLLEVKAGIQVLQAVPASYATGSWPKYGTPNAGYYVIRDQVVLRGNQIANPQSGNDQSGAPDVTFGFQNGGANLFQSITGKIAFRGQQDNPPGVNPPYYQHFAIALDNQLISVANINFNSFPEGIPASGGSEIYGGFTTTTAAQLATQLRLGALPVKLEQISENQVSATLGSTALHQGLIAGLVGLAVVVLLLLSYYRVLGLIAVGGLIAYGIYFYALIKLIPITMSLAGIAGLILTIGVAADANVVIFERVKEEIRGGRSIRQGIAIGYRKGITAIIDANVVTIMTAFILFVLATSDVKGFAFTLGIGTFVSLFTAVLATQAILTTMGDSRAIQSPSALGAGGERRHVRFDFMGASRYFFSMSGVILLIGALAIGGRGLKLGIDFTGGTQISVGLQRSAGVSQVKSLVSGAGGSDVTVQAVHNSKTLGTYGYQITSKYLSQPRYEHLRSMLENRFGIHGGTKGFNATSVGPAFGSSITHSALVAIIVSLIVISLYVALRFEWKFTVPVLIALMHDLLITAGVYALVGRTVTADTVAALLTILGYSLYDTIIVFDRVRENVPRMPRAAFSQVVNRSMSEVITRSLITTSCTLLPVIALLLFGGATLKDFAFALLIGVASGAYSSIFIASPVLTHWKQREHAYRARQDRIVAELGYVPAYAEGGDVDPTSRRARSVTIMAPQDENVSNSEFEQMKRDLGLDEDSSRGRPSRLSERTAHTTEEDDAPGAAPRRGPSRSNSTLTPRPPAHSPVPGVIPPVSPSAPADDALDVTESRDPEDGPVTPAPDEPENESVPKPPPPPRRSSRSSRSSRNRRHGRKR